MTPDTFLSLQNPLLFHESELWTEGVSFLAGIDEAGRGCCAGPVVAAAVIFLDRTRIPAGLNDSKQLPEKRRMELRETLLSDKQVRYGIGEVSAQEIDASDILRATWLAMNRALAKVIPPAEFILVDGNRVPTFPLPSRAIVKGDAKSASIAAASILAKTHRDLWMKRAAEEFPHYQFDVHKGYCTELHTRLIREFGPCPIHRTTFEPVKRILYPPEFEQGELF